MKLLHERIQHAVGQGGFHTAVVAEGDSAFTYAYDCGSMRADRLSGRIDSFAEEHSTLDVLFLSHLDQDHSNGVDKLLDLVTVDTVIVPYLSAFERLVLIAEAVAEPKGMASATTVLGLLTNPARWFRERGVRRVVFITEGEPPEGESDRRPRSTPEAPADSRHDAHPLAIDIPQGSVLSEAEQKSMGGAADGVQKLPAAPLPITKGGVTVWELTPFVQPEPIKAPAFEKEVAKLLGVRGSPSHDDPAWLKKLASVVADQAKRRVLANLYVTHLRRDRNLSSMSLYSGPLGPPAGRVIGSPWDPYGLDRATALSAARPAWIGTGDAHMDVAKRRTAFERFYAAVLPKVGTFMLPHHGSRHNLEADFMLAWSPMLWVAAYGTYNDYKHPNETLMRLAHRHGRGVRVTEHERSKFVEAMTVEWQ